MEIHSIPTLKVEVIYVYTIFTSTFRVGIEWILDMEIQLILSRLMVKFEGFSKKEIHFILTKSKFEEFPKMEIHSIPTLKVEVI